MPSTPRLFAYVILTGITLLLLASVLGACGLLGGDTTAPEVPAASDASLVEQIPIAQLDPLTPAAAAANPAAGLTTLPIAQPFTQTTQAAPVLLPTVTPEPTADPPGAVTSLRYVGRVEAVTLNEISSNIYGTESALPAQYAIDEYELRFTSYDLNNEPLTLLTQFFVPQVSAAQSFPLYVAGAGTTGIDDHCAPSLEEPTVRNMGDYRGHQLTYAAQGYIVALPDYEGFNDPQRIHHYFVSELEGRALLDTARAIYATFAAAPLAETQAQPAAAVFFGGYSQGGHAAFAARDLAATYAPDLPVTGVIGYGPTTDIATLLREGPRFAPYLVYAYADLYGAEAIDAAAILLPQWSANLEADVLSRCVDTLFDVYPNTPQEIYQPAFLEALYNNRLGELFPRVQERFRQNSSGLAPATIPALILQGLADPIVTPASQQAFVNAFCATGGRMTYITYPGVHHFATRQVGFADALAWMAQLVRGETPASSCA